MRPYLVISLTRHPYYYWQMDYSPFDVQSLVQRLLHDKLGLSSLGRQGLGHERGIYRRR